MARSDELLRAFEGTMIVINGSILIPIIWVTAIAEGISNYLNNAKPEHFNMFFNTALYLNEVEAKNLTFRYFACADSFGFKPGLGSTRTGSSYNVQSTWKLQDALRTAGIGRITANATPAVALKLSDYLIQHTTPGQAKSALTPAKRDALVFEAKKLLGLSPDLFRQYFQSRFSGGVRG